MQIGKRLEAPNSEAWREWLAANHAAAPDVWLVFYKKAAGRQWLSYEQALDEALSYGWVDSQMKRIDDMTYGLRFTPRRVGRPWAASNLQRAERLWREGRMTPAGLATVPEHELRRWQAEAVAGDGQRQ